MKTRVSGTMTATEDSITHDGRTVTRPFKAWTYEGEMAWTDLFDECAERAFPEGFWIIDDEDGIEEAEVSS